MVIADLSGGNPNVMYELGLRHTKAALTVQIGEVGLLPFDVRAIRTIEFRRSEGGLVEAREALMQQLREGLRGNFDQLPRPAFGTNPKACLGAILKGRSPRRSRNPECSSAWWEWRRLYLS